MTFWTNLSPAQAVRRVSFLPVYFLLYLVLFPSHLLVVLVLPQSSAYTYNGNKGSYKISPKPCTVDERQGTCMFVWECIKSEGKHLGMCVDGFMFGSCCGHNSSTNAISDHSTSSSFGSSSSTFSTTSSSTPGFHIWSTSRPSTTSTTSTPRTTTASTFRPYNFPSSSSSSSSTSNFLRPRPTLPPFLGTNQNPSSTFPESHLPFVTNNGSSTLPTDEQDMPSHAALIGTASLMNHLDSTTSRTRPTPTSTTSTTTTTTERTTTSTTTPRTTSERTTQRPVTIYIDPKSTTTPQPNITLDRDYGCGVAPLHPQMRIVGGKAASFAEFPWMVSVRRTSFFGYSSTHRCGGALLNENWVATAGHCVDDLLTSQIRIRLGEHDFSRVNEKYPHVERGAAQKVVHPMYNFFTYEHDLALIKLEKPVILTPHISPICLPGNDDLLINENATVSGWGRLSEGGPLPSHLQHVQVPILSNSKCRDMFLKSNRVEHIPDIFICAGHENGGKDSCQGDSGGPLQVRGADNRYFLAGIISWGIGCAEPNMPGVCTRISKFRSWILKHVTA